MLIWEIRVKEANHRLANELLAVLSGLQVMATATLFRSDLKVCITGQALEHSQAIDIGNYGMLSYGIDPVTTTHSFLITYKDTSLHFQTKPLLAFQNSDSHPNFLYAVYVAAQVLLQNPKG